MSDLTPFSIAAHAVRKALEPLPPAVRVRLLAVVMTEAVREIEDRPVERERARVCPESTVPITRRQLQALTWIDDFIRTNSYPPSRREIGGGLGITSTNGVNDLLAALARKGFIEQVPGRSRGIRVLRRPEAA